MFDVGSTRQLVPVHIFPKEGDSLLSRDLQVSLLLPPQALTREVHESSFYQVGSVTELQAASTSKLFRMPKLYGSITALSIY